LQHSHVIQRVGVQVLFAASLVIMQATLVHMTPEAFVSLHALFSLPLLLAVALAYTKWVTLRARWVTLRARWVTLIARWVTLRARWVRLRARWVTLRALLGGV
jgi:hypothetical protein